MGWGVQGGRCRVGGWERTTVASEVNLLHLIHWWAKFGANLVTQFSDIRGNETRKLHSVVIIRVNVQSGLVNANLVGLRFWVSSGASGLRGAAQI